MRLLAVAVAVALLAAANAQFSPPDTGLGTDCWFRAPGSQNVYDLRPLKRSHPDDFDVVFSSNYTYKVAICGPSTTPGYCNSHGYGICQFNKDASQSFSASLGFWSGLQPAWREISGVGKPRGVELVFSNGDKCKNLRERLVTLQLICSSKHDGYFTVEEEDEEDCRFNFKMETSFACPHHVPDLPVVPRDYRAAVEVTNPARKESYWLYEIWEESNQRLRRDQYFHPAGTAITLIYFDTHMRYDIINGTKCTAHALSPTLMMWPSLFDLFNEHKSQLKYAGVHTERGIPCDVYEGRWTWEHPQEGKIYEEEAVWWFARDNQMVVENPVLFRRPVFAAFRSNRTHPLLTGDDWHYFTFMDLVEGFGHYYDRELELQWQWNCPGGPAGPDNEDTYDKMASGAVALLSFFMLSFGGFLGLVAHWYYLKKRPTLPIQSHTSETYSGDITSYHG